MFNLVKQRGCCGMNQTLSFLYSSFFPEEKLERLDAGAGKWRAVGTVPFIVIEFQTDLLFSLLKVFPNIIFHFYQYLYI